MSLQLPFGPGSGGEPIPVIPIALSDLAGRATPVLSAILDTGSDGTLIPMSILQAAHFRPGRLRRNLRTGGASTPLEIVAGYLVSMRLGTLELPDTYVYGSREIEDVILGRDVLNQLVFTYDGPRRLLDLLEP